MKHTTKKGKTKKAAVDRYCTQCQKDVAYLKDVGAIKPWDFNYPLCMHKV